jgi:flagellar biosynthesis protein FliQ
MRANSIPVVLLVKAVEETDPTHALLPLADREQATRETLRELGLTTADFDTARPGRRHARALTERSQRLAASLDQRFPVLKSLLERVRWPAWLTVLLLVGALVSGILLSALQEARRINILAFPFLGVIVWNLVIYLLLGAAWLRKIAGLVGPAVMPVRGRGLAAIAGRAVARPLRAIARRSGEVHVGLGRAVEAFVTEWARLSPPIAGALARRLLHLGSATLALGLIAGLYFRGIVFRYEAGWESTFLGPSQVLDVLRVVYGPAARLSGVALPASTDAVAALRWDGAGGGGDAAPWIHLIAVTLAIYVVIPRTALAVAGWLAELRSTYFAGMPPSLAAYARRVFGAAGRGMRSAVAVVKPYAYEPPAGTLAALQSMLARHLGTAVRLATQPVLDYGEEALAGGLEAGPGAPAAEAHVLLFSLGATPESENHGVVVATVRDAVQRARPAPELLIVVDEAPYAARMGLDDSYERRLDERRQLWRNFLAGYGLELTLLEVQEAA